jgi:hypothetical protein
MLVATMHVYTNGSLIGGIDHASITEGDASMLLPLHSPLTSNTVVLCLQLPAHAVMHICLFQRSPSRHVPLSALFIGSGNQCAGMLKKQDTAPSLRACHLYVGTETWHCTRQLEVTTVAPEEGTYPPSHVPSEEGTYPPSHAKAHAPSHVPSHAPSHVPSHTCQPEAGDTRRECEGVHFVFETRQFPCCHT